MTRERATRLAQKWASGGVCTLKDGEAQEYHKLALSALLEQPRWISVEERLPMIRTRVLVAYKDGVTVAEYRGYDACKGKQQMYWCGIKGTKHVLRSITHWMPLPSTEGLK